MRKTNESSKKEKKTFHNFQENAAEMNKSGKLVIVSD